MKDFTDFSYFLLNKQNFTFYLLFNLSSPTLDLLGRGELKIHITPPSTCLAKTV